MAPDKADPQQVELMRLSRMRAAAVELKATLTAEHKALSSKLARYDANEKHKLRAQLTQMSYGDGQGPRGMERAIRARVDELELEHDELILDAKSLLKKQANEEEYCAKVLRKRNAAQLCRVAALHLSRAAGHGVEAALLAKLQAALAEDKVICTVLPGGGLGCAAATLLPQALLDAGAGSASLSKEASAASVGVADYSGLVLDDGEQLDENWAPDVC